MEKDEQVQKTKLAVAKEELQKSQVQVQSLEKAVEKLRAELQNADQLKEYTSLVETELKISLRDHQFRTSVLQK